MADTSNLQGEPLQPPKIKRVAMGDRVFPFQFLCPDLDCISVGLSKIELYALAILSAIVSHSGIVNQEVIDQAIRGAGQFLDAIEDSTEE